MNLIKEAITEEMVNKAVVGKLQEEMAVQPENASDEQFYKACAMVVRDYLEQKRKNYISESRAQGRKQVYYLSMEFLMGKSLRNNLSNLGLTEAFEKALQRHGVKLENLYRCEPDPGLGNGGLGRLAACYLDGLATDGYVGTGYSILYEYGIFKQTITDGWQSELPDYWLPGGEVWLEAVRRRGPGALGRGPSYGGPPGLQHRHGGALQHVRLGLRLQGGEPPAPLEGQEPRH